ncbi:hypothetical protein CcaverHIS002_0209080 [Cutaneotrichosporon cavernicola]|uniref:DUF1682-domain-containing protein n=1 Tax=Cutaneotrichosporon cavernicola TaxID=279322 RepID=A0AA48I576_9TREE|nr:uncharacterized protein CcaverHIS019_0209090 [Cutaneotrichosporon cavernicola]BEI81748.1 hypothetical protein CcaverHIS002_0209080 [Cutaneotrichosporon cavernicola]BEI89547.1 hypothetical protein CcaverHIS019_0209090 [Cutaneotrichosporon cavernicola]BEI97320.1 hypothetical protein CcaverHIS631_0209090 [Cutaneotrichosporon cavernicola]BEJ05094.1 hypothetical protein CcaverHIS641_0209110 [Cutaneotrichosporon cavernicola]
MSGFLKAIAAITPATPQPLAREYDGLEFKWKMFVIRPAAFKFEGIMLAILGAYLLLHLIGKRFNMGRARNAFSPFIPTLQDQFTRVLPMKSSSSALHLVFATGRRNVLAAHVTLKLKPFHDLIQMLLTFADAFIDPLSDSSESMVFQFTLGRGASGFQGEGAGVWAIVNKDGMAKFREKRFDLTFPRMHESTAVPTTHALFSEHSDITDAILKTPNVGVAEVLADRTAARILKALIITDAPTKRPQNGPLKPEQRAREIYLSVRKPTTQAESDAVNAWIQVALNLADLVTRPTMVKAEVTRKLVRTRQELDESLAKQFKKEQEEDNPPEQTAEEKRAARKRAERAKLSEKDQKRADELDRKREMRKMQKRGMAGMGPK